MGVPTQTTIDIAGGEIVSMCPSESVDIAIGSPHIGYISPRTQFAYGQTCPGLRVELDVEPGIGTRLGRPKVARDVANCIRGTLVEACGACKHSSGDPERRIDAALLELGASHPKVCVGRAALSAFSDALREVSGHSTRMFRTRR